MDILLEKAKEKGPVYLDSLQGSLKYKKGEGKKKKSKKEDK